MTILQLAHPRKPASVRGPASQCAQRRGFVTVTLTPTKYDTRGPALFRLNVCRANDLAPLVDTFGDKLAEISGAHRHRHATEIGKPRLDLGIGKSSIDLLVELVDDLRGRVPRRADAAP